MLFAGWLLFVLIPPVRAEADAYPTRWKYLLRRISSFRKGNLLKPDWGRNLLDALCKQWTLDTITGPEVTDATLCQFTNIQ